MSDPTILPWLVLPDVDPIHNLYEAHLHFVVDGTVEPKRIGRIGDVLFREDAEFIVRACNSHDALVEACAAVLPMLPGWGVSADALEARIEEFGGAQRVRVERVLQLRAALALAITRGGDA